MNRLKTKWFCLLATLVVVAITAAGCIPTIVRNSPEAGNPTPVATTMVVPVSPGWTAPPAQTESSDLNSIAAVVSKVKPAVVAINVQAMGQDIFGNPVTQEGAGSGWIIDSNGLVVTNNHVVEGATTVSISLADGRTFTAPQKQVYTDPVSDLAVVKIDATGLPALTVGDSAKMNLGDWVIALGNSLGRGIRVTNGIVSEKGVSLDVEAGVTLEDLISTNAAINPGNSGGPLVNMAGQVVGITSAKISSVGVEGVGFAISINTAKPIIQQLITKGFVTRAYLGVSSATVNPFAVFQRNLGVDHGAYVASVGRDSPADKAGLKAGDVITKFNGKDISTSNELTGAIHAAQIGQSVEISYWRGKTQGTTIAVLTESPGPSGG